MRIVSFIVRVIGVLVASVCTLLALAIVGLTFLTGSEGHVRAAAEPEAWQLRLVAVQILVIGVCLGGGLCALVAPCGAGPRGRETNPSSTTDRNPSAALKSLFQ